MKKFAVAAALLIALPLFGAESDQQQKGEEKELAELLSIVQQETDVATKTRMNSDYVPGIVTVLEGDDLEALGVATAGEALGLVPGMVPQLDDRASESVIVRGLDFPFNNGNILILVNSIPLSRQDAGINSSALSMPVEQIERIEVIRGPGSVLYGDYAFMGLVNIVTRKEATRLFLRAAEPHPFYELGARSQWSAAGTKVGVNLSRYTSNHTPAPATEGAATDDRWFGTASIEHGGFSLTAETQRRAFSPSLGPAFSETSNAIDGKYTAAITPKLHSESHILYLKNDLDDTGSQFRGNLWRLSTSATWEVAHQSILAGADYTTSHIDRGSHRIPSPPGQPPGPPVLLAENKTREIVGVTLQDQFEVMRKLTVVAGARYDSYSDFQSRTTPRAAVIFRVNDRNIFKAQYAEGFRPPTFFELYTPPPPHSTPRYAFEVNATTELNYVYRDAGRVGRLTVFRSEISNMIQPGGVLIPKDAKAVGEEAEWSQQLAAPVKVDANLSHVDTVDPRVSLTRDASNAISPHWLGNLSLFYRPAHSLVIGARYHLVGDRPAGSGFHTLDLTLSREDLFVRGLQVRAGVKNAADDKITYFTQRPTGDVVEFDYPGRSAWVQLSWKR
ncbi:MAG TPA: TonB-dependent receptor [Thermoanaerobaculia bacterium]|nr:TonB-dependent receptor [Thermoanaerobaculia bacterium]